MEKWITLVNFVSSGFDDKSYHVKLNIATGVIGCNCPAWVCKRNVGDTRWCNHTAAAAKLLSCKQQRQPKKDKVETAQLALFSGDKVYA